jgi:hypothetical protein
MLEGMVEYNGLFEQSVGGIVNRFVSPETRLVIAISEGVGCIGQRGVYCHRYWDEDMGGRGRGYFWIHGGLILKI